MGDPVAEAVQAVDSVEAKAKRLEAIAQDPSVDAPVHAACLEVIGAMGEVRNGLVAGVSDLGDAFTHARTALELAIQRWQNPGPPPAQ